MKINIDNLKCGGCANTIIKKLSEIEGVSNVSVCVETSIVSFESNDDVVSDVILKLASLGYPQSGSENTLKHKAKSFVSCAVGRIS